MKKALSALLVIVCVLSVSAFAAPKVAVKAAPATVTASGGVGAYSYSWSTTPVQTTPSATNLSAGTYYVTVSDGTCSKTDTVIIQNIPGLSATITNIVNEN